MARTSGIHFYIVGTRIDGKTGLDYFCGELKVSTFYFSRLGTIFTYSQAVIRALSVEYLKKRTVLNCKRTSLRGRIFLS